MSEILSSKLRRTGDLLMHWCPGCNERHLINVVRDGCGPAWDWNSNVEAPTLSPSILIQSGHYANGHAGSCWCDYARAHPESPPPFECRCCHYFIRDGQIQFCPDSSHALAGKTVPMPDFPDRLSQT